MSIVAGDTERISTEELRSLFCGTPHSSVVITAIFDACHSGGSLALPYFWDDEGNCICKFSDDKSMDHTYCPTILQISACGGKQQAFSAEYTEQGRLNGMLTWNLCDYFESNKNPTIEGLTEDLRGRFRGAAQTPQPIFSNSPTSWGPLLVLFRESTVSCRSHCDLPLG